MKITIVHKSGKTWEVNTLKDMDAFYNDPLYNESDESEFTFNGMSWKDYYKTVILPLEAARFKDRFDGFEED